MADNSRWTGRHGDAEGRASARAEVGLVGDAKLAGAGGREAVAAGAAARRETRAAEMKAQRRLALGARVWHPQPRSTQDVEDIPAGGAGRGEEVSGPGGRKTRKDAP